MTNRSPLSTAVELLFPATHPGRLSWKARGLIAGLVALSSLLAGCAPSATPAPATQRVATSLAHTDLAVHYAPVIHQGTASDQDYLTAVDFDGDWIGMNNWENQPDGDLSAHVYYSVVETESHWFLFYALFHPRDYIDGDCAQEDGCHENDLESIQLVVAKDGTPAGRLLAMETLAHGDIFLYQAAPAVEGNGLSVSGGVKLEASHPVVYVEMYGHGIYGTRRILYPGSIIYRVGDTAQVPSGIKAEASYRLVSIYETLWAHREAVGSGKIFDQAFDYRGRSLPATFDGADFGTDRANTPWGYTQANDDVLLRGDWFLDPAKALAYHARFADEFSTTYVHNPYLADLGLLNAP